MMELALYHKPTAVELRRELAKKPAVLNALEPVERAVFLASIAKPISEYSEKELAAELNNTLTWIAKDIGFRSTDEREKQYLVIRTAEILKRYYANFSMKDFRMAFEMSLTGELDDFLPKGRDGQPDKGHYQQFNAEYVCKILNAYKARRGWVLKKARESEPKMEHSIDDQTKRANYEQICKDLVQCFETYRATGRLEASPIGEMLYYNILAEHGLAKPVEVTEAEQRYILQRTINQFAKRGMVGTVNKLHELGIDNPALEHDSFVYARRKALEQTFVRMINENIDINQIWNQSK